MSTDDIEVILEGLRRKYLGSLPGKLDLLESFWRAADLPHVKGEFHKFKGTGLTYGFPEITDIGRIGELLCEARPETLSEGFPLAIELLRWSLALRLRGETPELAAEPRWQRLQALTRGIDQLP